MVWAGISSLKGNTWFSGNKWVTLYFMHLYNFFFIVESIADTPFSPLTLPPSTHPIMHLNLPFTLSLIANSQFPHCPATTQTFPCGRQDLSGAR